MLELDFTFPRSHQVEELRELPGTGEFSAPVIYFPPSKSSPEHNGLWLRVRANIGKAWVGVFAFGWGLGLSRVFSSPDPNRLCVISRGGAYVVNDEEPELWEQIQIIPVLEAT